MPLVVPGLQSADGKDDWMSKLMGKKLGDQHDEMVSFFYRSPPFPSPFSRRSVLLRPISAKLIYFTTSK